MNILRVVKIEFECHKKRRSSEIQNANEHVHYMFTRRSGMNDFITQVRTTTASFHHVNKYCATVKSDTINVMSRPSVRRRASTGASYI